MPTPAARSPWHSFLSAILVWTLLAACGSSATPAPTASPTPAPSAAPPTAVPTRAPLANRIGIRTTAGQAEFYDTVTGAKFTPLGANYVDFAEITPGELWEDYVFGAGTYQPQKVRAAFQRLSQGGYNTVRMFFDLCAKGPACIGNPSGPGLNSEFLDNMAEVMTIAGEERLYLLFTANSIPIGGQYWDRFVQQFNSSGHPGFDLFHENGNYLHAAGVAMYAQYWRDLMSGLAQRGAPFEVMLGWELQNEHWLFNERPPLSLDSGTATISNGQSYDLSDPEQKRQMVNDGIVYWMETLIGVIRKYDAQALVTVGFFPPNFPNDIKAAPEWYRDPAALLKTAPVDFWDFHAYPPAPPYIVESMKNVSENFGIIG